MQDREKKLAIVFAGVLVVAGVLPLFEGWFLHPVTEKRGELESVQSRVDQLTNEQTELFRAQKNLEIWQYQSLPPDRFTAQRLYDIWLRDLARMSGFSSIDQELGSLPARGRTFVEIPVTITAKATLEQLARFLYHFERAALLHRIRSLDVTSPASVGNPLLDVTLVCRGLSLVDATPRSQLFPRTTLAAGVTAQETTLAIESMQGFPLIDGFQVKIDEEFVTIRDRAEGHWIVERGAERTLAVDHPAGTTVELFPIDREVMTNGKSFEDYEELLSNSPFTKPKPPTDYRPELSPSTQQIVTRGTPWTLRMTVSGWDPEGGPAVFSLGEDVPPGLSVRSVDARTGELAWNPGEEIEAKVYNVPVHVRSGIQSAQQIQILLPVKLREPNLPPTISQLETITAYSGRPLAVNIEATDPDGDDEALAYALTGDVPSGAAVDEQTGELKWTPPLTLELGEYKLTASVTDTGDPPQTATQDVSIMLEDDVALFTRLVGVFKNGGEPTVMLRNQAVERSDLFSQGDEVRAADVVATITAIEQRHILLQVGSETFRLEMGDNLRQLTPVKTSAPPTTDASSG